MRSSGPAPAMTPGRAALIELMARYSTHALGDPSLIEIQKLMYFLQVAGEDLQLNYVPHHYGPYADNLRHVLVQLEGHYTSGFGDGSTMVQQAEPLRLLPGAREAALAQIATNPETIEHIERVITLIEGFESAYAVELLATVHWVLANADNSADDDAVIETVRTWSSRKASMFTADHVRTALAALRERGWSPALTNAPSPRLPRPCCRTREPCWRSNPPRVTSWPVPHPAPGVLSRCWVPWWPPCWPDAVRGSLAPPLRSRRGCGP